MTYGSFQGRVLPWMLACFGAQVSSDTLERNYRFLEEALELVQACGCTAAEAHQLVDYVFGRPVGDCLQEVGGVMVTLAALCLAQSLDMHEAGEIELARVWTKVEQIRAKQASKPKHSPLPQQPHLDDLAVDAFALAMKAKMKFARENKGRHGWETCAPETLRVMLDIHVEKGDPVDVANFCMMLHRLGQRTIPTTHSMISEASGG